MSPGIDESIWVNQLPAPGVRPPCRAQDKPAAQVLREFMRDYVAKHRSELLDTEQDKESAGEEWPEAPERKKGVRPEGRSVGAALPPYARGIVTGRPRPAGAWGAQRLEPNPAQRAGRATIRTSRENSKAN